MQIQQSRLERINQLQRQIIIHSIIYYIYNDNIWTDEQFDKACNELVSLKSCPEFPDSCFYESFKDFEGETGTHLAYKFKGAMDHIAYRIWKYHNERLKAT